MKFLLRIVLFAALWGCFALLPVGVTGCASVTQRAIDDAAQVQLLLAAILPPDFTGDFSDHEDNMYFDYTFNAGGLHRVDGPNGTKVWAFTWLYFDGNGHFPLTPALAWVGHHHIELGKRPATQ